MAFVGYEGYHRSSRILALSILDRAFDLTTVGIQEGGEHPETLATRHDLAVLFEAERRHAEAEVLFGQVLRSRRSVLGQTHPDTLNTLVSLGVAHLALQKFGAAEDAFREALAQYEKT